MINPLASTDGPSITRINVTDALVALQAGACTYWAGPIAQACNALARGAPLTAVGRVLRDAVNAAPAGSAAAEGRALLVATIAAAAVS